MTKIDLGTIHGYTIKAVFVLPKEEGARAGRVILVDRGEGHFERYVVSCHYEEDSEWAAGTYCDTLETALEVFVEIVTRRIQ